MNLTNDTVHLNGSKGVWAYASPGASTTMNVKNSVVTQHAYGIYRDSGGGTQTMTTTYSDIWGNTTSNYFSASAGMVRLGQSALRRGPVEPAHHLELPRSLRRDTAADIGALPYVSDATAGFHGTLWTNTAFTLAGSPYTLQGDVTVPAGVTVTIDRA